MIGEQQKGGGKILPKNMEEGGMQNKADGKKKRWGWHAQREGAEEGVPGVVLRVKQDEEGG